MRVSPYLWFRVSAPHDEDAGEIVDNWRSHYNGERLCITLINLFSGVGRFGIAHESASKTRAKTVTETGIFP